MAQDLVFFVHGMGSQKKDWHEDAVQTLRNAWKTYKDVAEIDFDTRVKAVGITYSDIFDEYREKWAKSADNILKLLDKAPAAEDTEKLTALVKTGAKALASSGGENFFWTHIADVILYRFCSIARQAVDVRVANRIAKTLKDMESPTWSVVAHSLGTTVVHNTLCKMFKGAPAAGIPALTLDSRPYALAMVSNVSHLLQLNEPQDMKVFNSPVFPGKYSSGALCRYYLNIRHGYDPFTWPKEFSPDQPGLRFAAPGYLHIRPETILGWNTHDLSHYLRLPTVHAPLFRLLRGEAFLTQKEEDDAARELAQISWNEGTNKLRHWFDDFRVLDSDHWSALPEIVKKYFGKQGL